MKKIFFSIILSGLFIAAIFTANNAFAETSFEAFDGDKKVKKETPRTEKKAVKAKDYSNDQDSIEPITIQEENSSEESTYPDNPQNNFDCTKEGFDRE